MESVQPKSGLTSKIIWLLVAVLGAVSFGILALSRGEHVNAVWLVLAAVCVYSIAYRFYSLFIATKVFELNERRLTPAHRLADGLDYVPTNKGVLFGHHFAAIAGAGPLVGHSCCTNGVFARDHLAFGGRSVGGCSTGLFSTVYFDPSRWSLFG
jgi:carbon starvation protein